MGTDLVRVAIPIGWIIAAPRAECKRRLPVAAQTVQGAGCFSERTNRERSSLNWLVYSW